MKNLHIDHIEDSILTGDLSAIELLYNPKYMSVKMDGSPAIVWGTDPATGTFFVGTKAVFNKKKIRIAHSHEEIDQHYHGPVADILHVCFKYLPRTTEVYQGEFIGFGNGTEFKSNLITYRFSEHVSEKLIIAPHTFYTGEGDLRNMVANPLFDMFDPHPQIRWVQPSLDRLRGEGSAPKIDTRKIKFLSKKEAEKRKTSINLCIQQGIPLTDEILCAILGDIHLVNLYLMVLEMKEEFIDSLIITDAPVSLVGPMKIKQEGFVVSDGKTTVKLVDREVFSCLNFNMPKHWAS
jgi:hypothetical protein